MNTNDKNTKLTKMTNTIINCTEKDNYEDLIYEITMDTIPQFIQSFAGLLNTLSEPVINSIKECFITSIIAKEHRDMKHYENEHELIKGYNDQVCGLLNNPTMNLMETQTVENCIKLISALRKDLIENFKQTQNNNNPPFLQKLFCKK